MADKQTLAMGPADVSDVVTYDPLGITFASAAFRYILLFL